MHLAFAIRGHKHWQDRFIQQLSDRYLPFKFWNPDTKQFETRALETRLCPIQLYDFVFPEEYKDAVLNTIIGSSPPGSWSSPKLNKYFWFLRKAMGFEKIPEFKKDSTLPLQLPQGQEIIGIGIKKDYWINPKTGEHIYEPTDEQKKECYEGI